MNLRKPCPHKRYDAHMDTTKRDEPAGLKDEYCPGGEFLADDAHAEFEMEADDGTKRRYMIVALSPRLQPRQDDVRIGER